MCAYVAAVAWLGNAECIGSVMDGYIVVPPVTPPHVGLAGSYAAGA